MQYCSVVYLALFVGAGAGKYLLAQIGDEEINTKGQNTNIRFVNKHTLLFNKIMLFSVGKIILFILVGDVQRSMGLNGLE